MTATATKPGPVMTWPPALQEADAQLRHARTARQMAEAELEVALAIERDAAREADELTRKGVDLGDVISPEVAARDGLGSPPRHVSYFQHRRPSPERIEALRATVDAARRDEQKAERKLAKLRAEGKTFDLIAECEKAGTRFYAYRNLAVNGRRYWQNQPIEPDQLAHVAPWRRQRWIERRLLGELPS